MNQVKPIQAILKGVKKRRTAMYAEAILAVTLIASLIYGDKIIIAINVAAFTAYTVMLAVTIFRDMKSAKLSSENPLLSSITRDFVTTIDKPVVIVDKECKISWYNKAFINICPQSGALYGKNITDEISHNFNAARLFRDEKTSFSMDYMDRSYEIDCCSVVSGTKHYCIIMWTDNSELVETKALLDSKNTLVAFAVIDNFSEAMQFVQDKSRTASAVIGGVLDSWCASIGGIIKEYDREKYVIIFEKSHLDDIRDNKFDILDKIRAITIDDVAMQFTASIGIARIDGTLSEKEAASRACLDLALQRGGDQAVVKDGSTAEFYGGRSKTVQKKTKVRSRVVANELCTLMKNSSNVLVMGHKYADHDSIASCVAVSRVAKQMGVPVNVVVNIHDFNLKAIFNSMRGQEEYTELFVDREYAQELVRSDTLLVVCDVNNVNLFEVPEIYEAAAKFVVIDHHRKTADFVREPVIAYIEPAVSSVSEIMCEILEEVIAPGTLPTVEANLIFAGIVLDTKQFTKNTGTRTFGAALYLRGEGANPYDAQKLFRTSAKDFMRQTDFENNIQIYRDCIAISVYEGDASNSDRITAAKAADRLLSIDGVSTSFVLCAIGDEISISARSDGNINVQLVLEALGGGGHFDAAGAQVKNSTMEQTLKQLKQSIDSFIGE